MSRAPAIVFAAGGTGGHLYPAIAVADAVRELAPDARIVFVGTRGRIEELAVPRAGYAIEFVRISGLRRGRLLANRRLPLQIVLSTLAVWRLCRRIGAGAVVGAGAYVTFPAGLAALVRRIPLILMESNCVPGKVNRMLSRRATEVHIAFDAARRGLRRADNVRLSGNPVRRALLAPPAPDEARRAFGLDPDRATIFVSGGSLGAASINRAVSRLVGAWLAAGAQVIWQTGRGAPGVEPEPTGGLVLEATGNGSAVHSTNRLLIVREFIDDMAPAYSAADVAVTRSGAMTVTELAATGTPAFLVPMPHATNNEQSRNAEAFFESGAAIPVPDGELGARLAPEMAALLADAPRRMAMRVAMRALARPDAARTIAESVLRLAAR